MEKISFELINHYGQVVKETNAYAFFQLAEVKDRYDSNFMRLKQMPSCKQFEGFVEELKGLASVYGNPHGKLVLPENCKPVEALEVKAKELGFDWSFLELYTVEPTEFLTNNSAKCDLDIEVKWIPEELVEAYGQMHFEESVQWGEAYATAIRAYKKGLIEKADIRIAVAVLDGELVGSTDVIMLAGYAEIDKFFVKHKFQKRGIGTVIQQFVMQEAEAAGRSVILVADGEDTPSEMYLKQGYAFVAFQYAALCGEFVK